MTPNPITSTLPRLGLLALLTLLPASAASTGPAAKLTLKPSYGGAVLEGRIYVPGNDALTGVWSGAGLARLMKCSPRCTVVSVVPLQKTTLLNNASAYRVALGGQFKIGQKVNVTLRFKSQGVLVVPAVVTR